MSSNTLIELYNFLYKYKQSTSENITHISMGKELNERGKYNIPTNKIKIFHNLYNKALKDNHNLYIAEKHNEVGPIIIDIDMKYTLLESSDCYILDNTDIEKFIKILNNVIKYFLDIEPEHYKVYLFRKNKPTNIKQSNGNIQYKDGFHLIYPEIITSINTQYIIRETVLENINKKKIFDYLSLDNDYNDMYDKAVIGRNSWLMYGSGKSDDKNSKYILREIYNLNGDKTINDESDLVSYLSIRRFNNEHKTSFNKSFSEEKINELYIELENKSKKTSNKYITSNIDIERCRKLVDLLDVKRAESYSLWIEVGLCLHNIDDDLLIDWIDFSKKSIKFKDGECENLWSTFSKKNDGLNIGSLYRWVKKDNLEEFIKLIKSEYNDIIIKSISNKISSGNIANVFYELYKYDFLCIDTKQKIFYEFKNHIWQEIYDAITIRDKLQNEFSNFYRKIVNDYNQLAMVENNTNDINNYHKYAKMALDAAHKLTDIDFKNKIITELTYKYYNKQYRDNLNENKDLLAFNNGVYDLKNKILREGYPEDCITLCTKINYIPYNKNILEIQQVEKFLSDILPKKDIREYLIKLFATCLSGNQNQLFPIFTGTGANGKSKILKLLADTLGDYATTIGINFLTSKKTSSTGADPELAKLPGIRLATFEEPESNDKIYTGNMKIMTGGDKISTRKLYCSPFEFTPQAKFFLACNDLPSMSSFDGGTKRRTRVIKFDIKFVQNPRNKFEKKANHNIDYEMKMWKEALMSLLIKYYNDFNLYNDKFNEPDEVIEYTKQYQNDSDIYSEYIDSKIIFTNDDNNYILLTNLYENFKEWLKEEGRIQEKGNKTKFKNEMNNKLTQCKNNKFFGIKIKDYDNLTDTENHSINTIDINNINNNKNIKNNSKNNKTIIINDLDY